MQSTSTQESPVTIGTRQRIPAKILILLLGAIGDVTRALPLAVRIKKAWPKTSLHWAVEPICRGLVEQHPAVDNVIVFDRPRGISAYIHFLRELRNQQYDLVLDLQRHLKSGFTSMATGAKRRLGFHPFNAKEFNWLFNTEYISRITNERQLPKIVHYQKFADALALPVTSALDFGFLPQEQRKTIVRKILHQEATNVGLELSEDAPCAALIIGSTWESRLWPAKYFEQITRHIFQRWGIISMLIGGENEREFAKEVLRGAEPKTIISLVAKLGVQDLPTFFSRMRFAIGVDSGPTHIAAAVNCPVIALFGSTSPSRSVPFHPGGPTPYLLQSPVGCSPCYLRKCPGLNTLCMSSIYPYAVHAYIDTLVERNL